MQLWRDIEERTIKTFPSHYSQTINFHSTADTWVLNETVTVSQYCPRVTRRDLKTQCRVIENPLWPPTTSVRSVGKNKRNRTSSSAHECRERDKTPTQIWLQNFCSIPNPHLVSWDTDRPDNRRGGKGNRRTRRDNSKQCQMGFTYYFISRSSQGEGNKTTTPSEWYKLKEQHKPRITIRILFFDSVSVQRRSKLINRVLFLLLPLGDLELFVILESWSAQQRPSMLWLIYYGQWSTDRIGSSAMVSNAPPPIDLWQSTATWSTFAICVGQYENIPSSCPSTQEIYLLSFTTGDLKVIKEEQRPGLSN